MGIAVIEKTFLVLERLAEDEEPQALARLAADTGLPKPTAYRLLRTLVELGYVVQDDAARYGLTTRLAGLAQHSQYRHLKLKALPHMERLHRQFNETVNLGVLDGTNVRYIHVMETTRPLRMMVQPNASDQFYSTAIGKAIASNLSKPELDSLLKATTIRRFTERTIKSKAELRKVLEQVSGRGWAIDDEESTLGVACIGVALMDDGQAAAGISITVPKTRLSPELKGSIVDALKSIPG